jgi:hypothetical protein
MPIEFACDGCRRVLSAREDFAGRTAVCPSCGAHCLVPGVAEPLAVQPAGGATALAAIATAPAVGACPSCDAPLSAKAVLCIECGYDRRTGKQRQTRVKRLDRRWTAGPSLVMRLIHLAATFFVLLLCVAVAMLAAPQRPWVAIAAPIVAIVALVVQLYFLGRISEFRLHRSRDGPLMLQERRRLFFVPRRQRSMPLDRFEAIEIFYRHYFDLEYPWWSGWYYQGWYFHRWYFHRLDDDESYYASVGTCWVKLRGARGGDVVVYRGPDNAEMRAIVELIQEVTGLPIERGK